MILCTDNTDNIKGTHEAIWQQKLWKIMGHLPNSTKFLTAKVLFCMVLVYVVLFTVL